MAKRASSVALMTLVALLSLLPSHALAARSRMRFHPVVSAAAPDITVTITLTEFSITPATITVPLGEPVTFVVTDAGGAQHNLEVELEDRGIEQRLFATNLMPGETRQATFTFTEPGEWEMYCPVGNHRTLGMQGTILVAAAATPTAVPTPSPTTAPAMPTTTAPPTVAPSPTTARPATPTPRAATTPTPPAQLAPATGQPHERTGIQSFALLAAVLLAGALSAGLTARRRRSGSQPPPR